METHSIKSDSKDVTGDPLEPMGPHWNTLNSTSRGQMGTLRRHMKLLRDKEDCTEINGVPQRQVEFPRTRVGLHIDK